MSLVLVITVAIAALADAGYQYNEPSMSFGLSGNQPGNFQSGRGLQHHTALPNEQDKSITYSISYKDYVYLKKDNVYHNNKHHQSIGSNEGSPASSVKGNHLNNGYSQNLEPSAGAHLHTGYAQPLLAPALTLNNIGHTQNFIPITSGNTNSGYLQTSSLSGAILNHGDAHNPNSGYGQTSSASASTHLTSGSVNSNLNSGPAPTSSIPVSSNLNTGYTQTLAPSVNVGLSHGYAQTSITPVGNHNADYSQSLASSSSVGTSLSYAQNSIPSATSNFKTGYSRSQASSSTGSLSHGNAQTSISLASANLNTGYSQTLPQPSGVVLSHGYSQTISSNSDNLNTVYSPASSGFTGLSNSYVQTSTPSAGGNLNTGYSQTLAPSGSESLSSGYAPTVIPPGESNLNTGYLQSIAPSGKVNDGYAQTSFSSASSNLNNGYSQKLISSGSGNLNSGYSAPINTGYSQPFTPPISVSLNSAEDQISTINNLNAEYVQNLLPQISASSFSGNTQTLTGSNKNLNIGLTQTRANNDIIGNTSPVGVPSSVLVTPTIFKHIYFHVSPPEGENQKVAPLPPPKKNYKIIFIKVPTQESKSNLARLQQIAEMRNAASVEHRTLIYVLVQNPETQQPVLIQKQTPSKHEVFFVKYNGNPLNLAVQVNEELNESGSVQSIVPLEPGLVNGYK